MKSVKEKLTQIIADKLQIDVEKVVESANIRSDLNADSLDVLGIVTDIEKYYKIYIHDEDFYNIRTVGKAIKYIENRI